MVEVFRGRIMDALTPGFNHKNVFKSVLMSRCWTQPRGYKSILKIIFSMQMGVEFKPDFVIAHQPLCSENTGI